VKELIGHEEGGGGNQGMNVFVKMWEPIWFLNFKNLRIRMGSYEKKLISTQHISFYLHVFKV